MKKTLYSLLLLCFLFSACKDDEVPSRTIFTFTGGSLPSNADYWIVLHDNESGELIDSKQVFGGQTTTFESTKKISGGKLAITILRASNPVGYNSSDVYYDIDLGSEWTYSVENPSPPHRDVDGNFDLNITDVPSILSGLVSDKRGATSGSYRYTNGTLTFRPIIFSDAREQLVSVDIGTGNPKYQIIDNLTDGNPVTISYNNFKNFDKYIKVTFPQTNVFATEIYGGYEDPDAPLFGYRLHDTHYEENRPGRTELNVGFLNSVPNYYIVMFASGWNYRSQGNLPSSIDYVSPSDYLVSGNTMDEFKIEKSKDYIYTVSMFDQSSSTSHYGVVYHIPKGQEKFIDPLTSEIEQKYLVEKDGLSLYMTEFYVKGRSYYDMIRASYDATYDRKTSFEETMIQSPRL